VERLQKRGQHRGAVRRQVAGETSWKRSGSTTTVPSWAVVATGDKAAGTDIVRTMAQRAGANVVEIEGSHLIMVSQPEAVTDVILEAARAGATQ